MGLLNLNRKYNSKDAKYDEWLHPFGGRIDVKSDTQQRLHNLGLFVYGAEEYFYIRDNELETWQRPYISFWCPERTMPLSLIEKLRERSDVTVCAVKLHPFQVVCAPAEPIYLSRYIPADMERPRYEYEEDSKIEAIDLSKDYEFWNLDNVQREKPWLIDMVGDWDDLDLVGALREAIDQCKWSND